MNARELFWLNFNMLVIFHCCCQYPPKATMYIRNHRKMLYRLIHSISYTNVTFIYSCTQKCEQTYRLKWWCRNRYTVQTNWRFRKIYEWRPDRKKKKNKLCYRFKRRWKKNWCVAKYIGIWRIRWIDPINLNRKTHRRSTFSVAVPCGNMCDKNQRMLWKIYNLNPFVPSATFSGPDSPFSFDFIYSP